MLTTSGDEALIDDFESRLRITGPIEQVWMTADLAQLATH